MWGLMGNSDYKYLVYFADGTEWSKTNFCRKFSEKELNYLLENDYIEEVRKQDNGDLVYHIIESGKSRCYE